MSYRIYIALAFCVVAFSAFAVEPQSAPAAPAMIDVPVPAHDVSRGDTLGEGDLVYKSIPVLRANDSIVRSIADASGKEVRRAMRAGELIRVTDVKRPTVVAKGSTVTMLFEAPGMTLTAVGRALAEGGEGDSITVLNPASFRQVQAEVVGPGTVRVGSTNGIPGALASAKP